MAMAPAIVGIICIVYGITTMAVRPGTLFHLVWYAPGVSFLVGGWLTSRELWSTFPTVVRRMGFALATTMAVGLVVTQVLVLGEYNDVGEPDLDYIVVLGAQVREDGSASSVLRNRLDTAFDYLRDNPRTICIVSGGQSPSEPTSEATCMAAYLEARGIDARRIVREDRSLDTVQNIANSKWLVGTADSSRVGIVTNDFHLFRALRIARHAGFGRVCGIAAPTAAWYQPNDMLREILCIVKELAVGSI